MKASELIEKANRIEKQISDLKYFLLTVVRYDESCNAKKTTNVLFKTKVEIKTSLLGSRYFGMGKHEKEISVPDCLRNYIVDFSENLLIEKENELSNLFNIK